MDSYRKSIPVPIPDTEDCITYDRNTADYNTGSIYNLRDRQAHMSVSFQDFSTGLQHSCIVTHSYHSHTGRYRTYNHIPILGTCLTRSGKIPQALQSNKIPLSAEYHILNHHIALQSFFHPRGFSQ